MKLNIILNRNKEGIIGVNNDLCFHIPDDLKWFKRHTENNIVIMGYNTWCSLPVKPLPNRLNIVLSSKNHGLLQNMNNENILSFPSFEKAKEYIETIHHNKVFIIGGSSLYDYIFINYSPLIDCIYLTEVDKSFPLTNLNLSYNNYKIHTKYQLLYNKNNCSTGNIYGGQKELLNYDFFIYQKKENVNKNEQQYLNLLNKVFCQQKLKSSRNSEVFSSFGEKMVFDLREGFPLLTTKKMGWKTVLRELLWIISGSTNNKDLQEKNVHIWDQNSSKEFLKSRGLDYKEGDLGPVYGFQWRHFGAEYKGVNHDYNEAYNEGSDQLKYIIETIKTDPDSRRLILSAWNPCDIDKMALPPCHVMVQFSIDEGFIDAQLYQRSGDMFLGVPFNIASYSFLLHIIGKITGYIPRYLHHILGDAHIYMNHLNVVEEQLQRVPYKRPQLIMNNIYDINHIEESDFNIDNYESYPPLRTEMIA